MLETKEKIISLEEFLQLPETKPASEYREGVITVKPMPKGKHSRLQGKLAAAIDSAGEPNKLALAFPELRCNLDNRSIVPDIVVLKWDRLPLDESGEIADNFNSYPDWIIEILSPEQNNSQIIDKILYCLDRGTELGWIIDPGQKIIMVFPRGQQPKSYREETTEVLPVLSCLGELSLKTIDIFGWLKI